MSLFHYTCQHGRDSIGRAGMLLPARMLRRNPGVIVSPEAWAVSSLVWATDMPEPDAEALGLTMRTIGCDRTQYRYLIADPSLMLRWGRVRSSWHPATRDRLELADGAQPVRWWVSREPVAAVLDDRT